MKNWLNQRVLIHKVVRVGTPSRLNQVERLCNVRLKEMTL